MDTNSYDKTIEALTLISRAITSDHYIEDILRLIVIVTAEEPSSIFSQRWLIRRQWPYLTLNLW
ncbi:MAG TPA: hypothetical protein ENI41_05690 [Deltaproteobacteria bacterium]|nr:hypothetical protein [Deltaproteobacteria bacterium]